MRNSARFPARLAALFALLLAAPVFACLQTIKTKKEKQQGTDGGGNGQGDDFIPGNDGGGNNGGHDEVLKFPDETIAAPVVTGCVIEDGLVDAALDEPVKVRCTAEHGGRAVRWFFSASPMNGHFTEIGEGRTAWVLKPADLTGRFDFKDTTFTITAAAADAEFTGVRDEETLSVKVFGNFWLSNKEDHSVMVMGSDGTRLGDVIGPAQVGKPGGLLQLSSGDVLVAEEEDGKKRLQVFDIRGAFKKSFFEQDLAQNDLYGEGKYPYNMMEHTQTGRIWATVKGEYGKGFIYIFDADGIFEDKIEKPPDFSSSFDPMGILELDNGNVLVTLDESRILFQYDPNGEYLSDNPFGFGNDFQYPTNIPGALRLSSGEILLAARDGSNGIAGKFTQSLGFLAATPKGEEWYNIFVYNLVEFRGMVLATTRYSGECVFIINPQTLTFPEPHCFTDSAGYGWFGGIIKLK